MLVDTLGLILKVLVTPANVQDYDGARDLLDNTRPSLERFQHLWADAMYRHVVPWIVGELGWTVEIVTRLPGTVGFQVQHWRWVIEPSHTRPFQAILSKPGLPRR